MSSNQILSSNIFVVHRTSGITNPNFQQTVYYTSPNQVQQLQNQVNDVTEIMKNNVRLGIERGENLDHLEVKAENLNHNSQQFALTSERVRKKYWWKNVKMWIIIITIVVVILIIIIVLSVLAGQHKI